MMLETETRVICERAFLAELDGSCRTPLAGHAVLDGPGKSLSAGQALTEDGVHCFESLRRYCCAMRRGSDARPAKRSRRWAAR